MIEETFVGAVIADGDSAANCTSACATAYSSSTVFFPVGVPGLVVAISHQAKVDYAALGIKDEVKSSDKMYTGLMMNVEEKTQENDFGVKQWFLPGETIRLPIKDLLE